MIHRRSSLRPEGSSGCPGRAVLVSLSLLETYGSVCILEDVPARAFCGASLDSWRTQNADVGSLSLNLPDSAKRVRKIRVLWRKDLRRGEIAEFDTRQE